MSDSSTTRRHRRESRPVRRVFTSLLIVAFGLLLVLIGFPADQAAVGAGGLGDRWTAAPAVCLSDHDVYRLDEPGAYTAFVRHSSTAASTHVRGSHGEMLAASGAGIAKTGAVDVLTGARFGVAPPPVFDVETSVLIDVQHHNSPYELVVVRLGTSDEWSGIDVRPPVTSVINESGSCLIGDLRETLELQIGGINSRDDARQVFLVESPVHRPEIDVIIEG